MHRVMLDSAPPLPTLADVKSAPSATAVTFNGSYSGILLLLHFPAEQHMAFHLNCVVAQELMDGINDRACDHGWWEEMEAGHGPNDILPVCDNAYNKSAHQVVAVTTAAIPEGILVHLKDNDGRSTILFLPKSLARGVAIAVSTVGEAAKWWDEEFKLLPAQVVDDRTIHRAANQMIKKHGKRAAREVAKRVNEAMAVGDKFNLELWQRVSVAVEAMKQTTPGPDEPIN
jgi:hypothetical protein